MFSDIDCIYLKPGEIYFADEPMVIHTVLGSCVSITMYSRRMKMGIMSHCMLPCTSENFHTGENCMKYTDCAILYMNRLLTSKGVCVRETEVKLFGGSDMFASKDASSTVGRKNVDTANSILTKMGYVLVAADTGGQFTRKLYFSIDTGTVYQRKISRMQGL